MNQFDKGTSGFSRRHFLRQSATALLFSQAAIAMAQKPDAALVGPKIGTQLYGWGQYYDRMGKNLQANMDEALSAIRDAGFDYAEGSLDVAHPENNARFGEQLKAKGLQAVSFYTGGRLHEAATADQTVEKIVQAAVVAKTAGFRIVNCNADPLGREKTDEELRTQAGAFQKLGKELNARGIKLGIHHHTPEMRSKAREFHHNFRHTEAKDVGFCYDVHWVYRGGVAPAQALADYADRIVSWHLRQSRDGIWWEDLDQGDIDYGMIAKVAGEKRIPALYTVELALESGTKITRTVVENHKRSRDFVQRVFAV